MSDAQPPEQGDQFRLPDGTHEVVFQVAEGRVLTVREYPSVTSYRAAIADAESWGTHEGVKDLPQPSELVDEADETGETGE